jgi:hypothetical protein
MSQRKQSYSKRAKLLSEPSKKRAALVARAKEVNLDHRRKVQHFIDSNKKLLDAEPDAYAGGGLVTFVVFLFYGVLGFEIIFEDDAQGTLGFSGTDYTAGLAAWAGFGNAVFSLSPIQLAAQGSGTVIVLASGLGQGYFELICLDSKGVQYGTISGFTNAGYGVAVGSVGGNYTWNPLSKSRKRRADRKS